MTKSRADSLWNGGLALASEWSKTNLQSYDFRFLTHNYRVQVNGKLRGTVEVPNGIQQGEAEAAGKSLETVAKFLEGKEIKKVIYVPGRILNFIAPGK